MTQISKKSCTKILIIFFIISLGAFIFSLWPQNKKSDESIKNDETIITPNLPIQKQANVGAEEKTDNTTSPTITILAGNLNTKIEFTEGETLYTILSKPKYTDKFKMRAKEYPGIGFFIEKIGDIEQGNGKYVMYSINGVEASVGVSIYTPKVNDVILFELK